MVKYKCQCCNYSTDDKSNFNKHITSRKHKLIESKSNSPLVSQSASILNQDPDLSHSIKELTLLVQSLNDMLDKQQKQINDQKLQIDNIISEIF
jgi:hypothetical protein